MLIMPPEALHFGQFCGMRRALAGPHCALRNLASGPVGDGSSPGFTRRRGAGSGFAAHVRLLFHVGASDDPGQDAQPVPHSLLLFRRVGWWRLACRCPVVGRLPSLAGLWPGGPGGRRRQGLVVLPGLSYLLFAAASSGPPSSTGCTGCANPPVWQGVRRPSAPLRSWSRWWLSSVLRLIISHLFAFGLGISGRLSPPGSVNNSGPPHNRPWGRTFVGAYRPLL